MHKLCDVMLISEKIKLGKLTEKTPKVDEVSDLGNKLVSNLLDVRLRQRNPSMPQASHL